MKTEKRSKVWRFEYEVPSGHPAPYCPFSTLQIGRNFGVVVTASEALAWWSTVAKPEQRIVRLAAARKGASEGTTVRRFPGYSAEAA